MAILYFVFVSFFSLSKQIKCYFFYQLKNKILMIKGPEMWPYKPIRNRELIITANQFEALILPQY